MTTTRGRKLIPRTAAERIGFLANIVGFGSDRREVTIGYGERDHTRIEIHACRAGHFQELLGEGTTLEEAIDRAISKNPRWKVTP